MKKEFEGASSSAAAAASTASASTTASSAASGSAQFEPSLGTIRDEASGALPDAKPDETSKLEGKTFNQFEPFFRDFFFVKLLKFCDYFCNFLLKNWKLYLKFLQCFMQFLKTSCFR